MNDAAMTAGQAAEKPAGRILVIDDDDQLREFIVALLRKRGYDVQQASSGIKAKAMSDAGLFDVVLTDIVMPDMEGLAVIRWLRSSFGTRMRVIAISGGGSDRVSYLHHAAKFGADATLAKPFSPPDLLATVAEQVAVVRAAASPAKAADAPSG